MKIKSLTLKKNMKVKPKEVRKRSVPLAKDHHSLRVFLALVVFCGILLSASLFYSGNTSISGVREIFHSTGEAFSSLNNLITGAAVGVEDIKIQSTCAADYASGGIINTTISCSSEVITVNGTLTLRDDTVPGDILASSFHTSNTAKYDLRSNSSGITSAIPDLLKSEAAYTNDWDTATGQEFYIMMNESQHQIQMFINDSNHALYYYQLDLDNNENTGDAPDGIDVHIGYIPSNKYLGPIILCNGSSIVLVNGSASNSSSHTCGNVYNSNFTQNYTLYWNQTNTSGGSAFEVIIDFSGNWTDKWIVATDGVTSTYTTFQNSTVNTSTRGTVGNLTLNNVTLAIQGNFTVNGNSYLTVLNSIINFSLTNNGSANFYWKGNSTVNINNSVLTSNGSNLFWGWRSETDYYNITNNNISNNGLGSLNYNYNNKFYANVGGRVYNNLFSNCQVITNQRCLEFYNAQTGLNVSSNTFNGPIIVDTTGGVNIENNINLSCYINSPGTNINFTNNIISDLFRLSSSESSPAVSGITLINNNFTNSITGHHLYTLNISGSNSIIYYNQYGRIRWENKGNLTIPTDWGLGNKVYLLNNTIGIADNVNISNLNTSAQITFYGLTGWGSNNPNITKNGVNCTDCTIISWNNGTGTLVMNVTSFSNYSAQNGGADITLPYFTYIPANTYIVFGLGFGVDFNATDNIALSYWWINDTHFLINQSGYLSNNSLIGGGTYIINVSINDTSSNINSTIYQVQVNQSIGVIYTYLNNARANYSITDSASIYLNATLINGTGNITLYNNGTLINNGSSPLSNLTLFNTVGLFNITSYYNGNENYTSDSETWWVSVVYYPPNVTLISPAANYANSSAPRINITFVCNASDDIQLKNISLYLTNSTNQSFSRNQTTNIGGTTNSSNWTIELSVGNYTWNCLAFDNASRSNFSVNNRSIVLNYTNSAPYFTNIPINQSIIYGAGFEVDFNATDNRMIDRWSINDTTYFVINQSGFLTNNSLLGAKTYLVNVTINDTEGAQNSTIYQVQINQSTPTITKYLNGVDANLSVIYPVQVNATGSTTGGTLTIYRNGTTITNGQNYALAVAYYLFEFNATGNKNYTNASASLYAQINQSNGTIYTYLNNARANYSITDSASIYLNASLINGTGNITLYNNGTLINNGSSPLSNLTLFNTIGLYNITSSYLGNQNYTSDVEVWWISVVASSSSSSSGGGGGGSSGSSIVIVPEAVETPINPAEEAFNKAVAAPKKETIETPKTEAPEETIAAPAEGISAPETEARANLFGRAIFSGIGEILSSYWVMGIISTFLLLTLGGGITYYRHKSKYRLIYPSLPSPAKKTIPDSSIEELNQRIQELKTFIGTNSPNKIIQRLPEKKVAAEGIGVPLKKAAVAPLRSVILETTPEKLKLDRELVDLQSRLFRLDQESAKPIKIIREIPVTRGIPREGEAKIREERKEFEGLSTILLQSLKRPYLLLRAFFPRHKSQEELRAEEFAKKEVEQISRKIEGSKPRPSNELVQLEQEIRSIREESLGLPEKAEQNKLKLLRELELLEQELKAATKRK